MLKKVAFSFIAGISLLWNVQAQNEQNWKFFANLDNRFSSIRNNSILLVGVKTGMQYKKKYRIGLGFSWMTSPVTVNFLNKKTRQTESNEIHFWYGSMFFDYVIFRNKRWEFFATEQLGYGQPEFKVAVQTDVVSDLDIPLYINEISTQINYKVTKGFGVGAGIGYRNLWNRKALLRDTFDAPIYILKVTLYPEDWF
ncbi:MAG: hypothetical protein CFE24_04060 [Flavobacterium sp. BFFFF2]|nr:MAG: hypothetical protein CFE24_04060 [Flavobacterium sp. BFFFF2]